MSNVTSLEYWNILDYIIFFVLISGTVDDHSSMSNLTCLECFVLQNIFYTSQNLSRNSSGGPQERVPCHSFGIFYTSKYFFTLEGHTSFSILVGALVLCLACCKKDKRLLRIIQMGQPDVLWMVWHYNFLFFFQISRTSSPLQKGWSSTICLQINVDLRPDAQEGVQHFFKNVPYHWPGPKMQK